MNKLPRYTPDQIRDKLRLIARFTPDDTELLAMLRQGAEAVELALELEEEIRLLKQEILTLNTTLDAFT